MGKYRSASPTLEKKKKRKLSFRWIKWLAQDYTLKKGAC